MYRILIFCSLLLGTHLSIAQIQKYKTTSLPLNDLQSFKSPSKNWKVVGNVSGNYTEAETKASKGVGILYNDYKKDIQFKEGVNLFTQLEHGDVYLSLDFLLPKGSNSGVYFQGRYEIQLFDSWLVNYPRSTDCGAIYERWDDSKPEGSKGYEGHPPRTNASLAPNLWQHLEVEFQAPRFDAAGKKISSAKFVKVVLNGVIIHENVIVSGPTRAAAFTDEKATGPIMFQGDHGPVSFRNIQYALLNDFDVKISDLSYEYYEGMFNNLSEATKDKLVRSGKADEIDFKLADNPNENVLVFSGKLTVAEADEYNFTIRKIGHVKLVVDGEEVIKPRNIFGEDRGSKNLSAGEHTFTFSYRKNFSWAPSGFGLYIGKANARPKALTSANSLPPVRPTPLITAEAEGNEPRILRSFMVHNGKKKTHVISVGNPSGLNYAYDLKQGGLLTVWRGDFLNVTDMWHERGEPQTAVPMGSAIAFADHAPLAVVSTDKSPLPDSLSNKDLSYQGYVLNEKQCPVFQYQYNDITFDDLLQPSANGQGLSRKVSVTGVNSGQLTYFRVAQGAVIEKVGDNIFAVDNQEYFIQLPGTKLKYEIKESPGKQELVIPVTGTSSFEYILVW